MFNYRKIIVIGCPGAGKSTFSRKLHEVTNIELFHLDAIYWNKDCTHIDRPKLIRKQKEIFKKDSYIIDGNFKSTLELRIKEADAVFFFDLPTEICINGVKNRKGNRPEMPCQLPDSEELIDFIKNFNTDVKPIIVELLKKYKSNVITFHSHKEADNYIDMIHDEEQWDAYDREVNKINDKILHRGEPIPNGIYHLVCDIIVKHIDGTYLIMQRDLNKHFGGMWELTAGGSALLGENPLECAARELREETGIVSNNLKELGIIIHDKHHSIYFEYMCITDCDKKSITLQKGETIDYKWVDLEYLKSLGNKLATTRVQLFIDELGKEVKL